MIFLTFRIVNRGIKAGKWANQTIRTDPTDGLARMAGCSQAKTSAALCRDAATPFRAWGRSKASTRLGGLCSWKKEGLQARADALATPGGGTGPTGTGTLPGTNGGIGQSR
jgi:hypothetical protein